MPKKKGAVQIFLGAASILIIIGIAYVMISLASPSAGNQITGSITALRMAVFGK